jgi:8-oxo-dGTP pyrophosphatase MutT (NUDIX family)
MTKDLVLSKYFSSINEFKTHIINCDLPGIYSQLKMAPENRLKEIETPSINIYTKNSAVLIPIFLENERIKTILIQRPEYDGIHSGQISFPGGKMEKNENLENTAKRETFEEIGIDIAKIEIVRCLTSLYIPPSNLIVYPFVGILKEKPELKPDKFEVSEIMIIDLDFFLNNSNIGESILNLRNIQKYKVPCFIYNEKIIWGATAMIIMELADLIKNKLLKSG